jgi:putative serine protease PepD
VYRLEFSSASGKTTSFDEQRVLRIGRSSENDIVLDSPSVSRRHGELRPTPTGWDLVDIGSTGGTWVDNQRVSHIQLGATTTVRFGAVSDGVSAFITVGQPHAWADGPPDDEHTVLLSDQQRTYIYGDGDSRADRPVDGLLIRTRDGDKRFDADKPVRVGRDARSDVIADDAAVSRHHANIGRRTDGWWFVDHSNSGSYIDGERDIPRPGFIVPVIVDDDYEGKPSQYRQIPDDFRRLHFGRAPGGDPDAELLAMLTAEIRAMRRTDAS